MFPNQELYCTTKFAVVHKEGDPSDYFSRSSFENDDDVRDDGNEVDERLELELPDGYEHLHGTDEDVALMEDMGFNVDDDNCPAPENIPNNSETENP